jgi:dTMP kinase|tara:strand:+ start:3334 stop:3948 length:615 start_codon:yes stop_codon:yes gene_type:complete
MFKYPIIVFEGVEGSGKSYHIKNIQKYLKKKKIKFIKLREPGGSINSEKIRRMILSNNSNFHKLTDLFLYIASRNENIQNIIKKNYKKKVILIDRFKDSTVAYQHFGMNINKKLIMNLNNVVLKNIKPNFTFLNIVNMKNLKRRIDRRKKNRYDKFNYKFYSKVQKGFIKLAQNKNNYMIVNSNNNILKNKTKILKKINSLLSI